MWPGSEGKVQKSYGKSERDFVARPIVRPSPDASAPFGAGGGAV
jgi:hypothetical protein